MAVYSRIQAQLASRLPHRHTIHFKRTLEIVESVQIPGMDLSKI